MYNFRCEYAEHINSNQDEKLKVSVLHPKELERIREEITKVEIDKDVRKIIEILPAIFNYPYKTEEFELPARYFKGEIFTGRTYTSVNWMMRALKYYFTLVGAKVDDIRILKEALAYSLYPNSFNWADPEALAEVKENATYKLREGMDHLC